MTNDFKNKQSSGARPPRLSPEEYAAKKKGGERSHLSTARQYRFGSGAVAGKIQSLP